MYALLAHVTGALSVSGLIFGLPAAAVEIKEEGDTLLPPDLAAARLPESAEMFLACDEVLNSGMPAESILRHGTSASGGVVGLS